MVPGCQRLQEEMPEVASQCPLSLCNVATLAVPSTPLVPISPGDSGDCMTAGWTLPVFQLAKESSSW